MNSFVVVFLQERAQVSKTPEEIPQTQVKNII